MPVRLKARSLTVLVPILIGCLMVLALHLGLAPVAQGASSEPVRQEAEDGELGHVQELWYKRTQTVTLHSQASPDVYESPFRTTFQFSIKGFHVDDPLYNYFRYPSDAILEPPICTPHPPGSCSIVYNPGCWGEDWDCVVFTGTGRADIYLAYETTTQAERLPDSREIDLSFRSGPVDKNIALTSTVLFGRPLEPVWEPMWITPLNYIYDPFTCRLNPTSTACSLVWVFTNTRQPHFEVTFEEILLGSDLVIDSLEMNPETPGLNEPVNYTVTIRNIGPLTTGRTVLVELFVRPLAVGPPVALDDHYGGWLSYTLDSLFKWEDNEFWQPNMAPGDVAVGSTVLEWPDDCTPGPCGVWAKVDPAYLDWGGGVYEWYGYNPEGMMCDLNNNLLPTCIEEGNNLAAIQVGYPIYLPIVFRTTGPEL